jgi:hypothetical protein
MPVRAFRCLAVLAALLCCSHRLLAQTDTTHVTLSGTVVDSDRKPLEGVEVRLVGDTARHFSSASGTFRLYGPRGVELLLQFRRPGYNAQLLKMTGDWNGTVLMVTGAFALPDIQVNANNAKPAEYAYTNRYDDFFRRKRQGLGDFITRAEIDRRNAFHTSDILQGRPGIKVQTQPDKGLTFVGFARCNEYPPMINVYVNGSKMIPQDAAKVGTMGNQSGIVAIGKTNRDPEVAGIVGEMLSRVNPHDVEFVEIFRGPGELPPEFNDGNCGAIVIWTK